MPGTTRLGGQQGAIPAHSRRAILRIVLGLAGLIGFYVVLIVLYWPAPGVTTLLIFGVTALLLLPLCLIHDAFHPFVIHAVPIMLGVLGYIAKDLSGEGLRYAPWASGGEVERSLDVALLLLGAYCVMFYTGYYAATRLRRRAAVAAFVERPILSPSLVAAVLCAGAGCAFAYAVSMNYGIAGMLQAMARRREAYAGLQFLRPTVQLSGIAAVLFLVSRRIALAWVVAILGSTATALFGGRSAAFLGTLLPFLIAYHYLVRRLSLRKLAVIAFGALIFFATWGDLRQVGQITLESVRSVVREIPTMSADAEIQPALIAAIRHGVTSLQWGRSLANVFVAPIPRTLWPEKPIVEESGIVGRALMGEEYWGLPPGAWAWGYFNFGVSGVIVFGLTGGFVVGRFYKYLLPAMLRKSCLAVLLYSFLVRFISSPLNIASQINLIWFGTVIILVQRMSMKLKRSCCAAVKRGELADLNPPGVPSATI